jgi:GH25 family lysozyme M1 (1,4-beta-N-acetylmuramidase)
MRARGHDWSRWQGQTDVEQLGDKADFIMPRCTIGWSYLDPWYIHNFKTSKEAGKLFGPYHVLYPSNEDPKREAAWFKSNAIVDGVMPDFIVCDLELTHGLPPSNVLEQCRVLAVECGMLFGLVPRIYSASWFWNGNNYLGSVTPGGWENDFPLIEAEYLTPPGTTWKFGDEPQEPKEPATLSKGWDDWWMWQWTDRIEPIGVSSKQQDADVYNGTLDELKADLGIGSPQLTDKEKLDILWEAHPNLHPQGQNN